MRRMLVTWLPMWKCMSLKQSVIFSLRSSSKASISSDELSPNLLTSPPDSSHLPLPELASLMRMPMLGFMPMRFESEAMVFNSIIFSTTRNILRPIL